MHQVYEQVAKEDQNVSSLRTNNPRDDFEFEGSSTFVEIESYETLKAKVEKRGRELAKLTNKVLDKNQRLKQAEEDLQDSYRHTFILKKDVTDLVDQLNRLQWQSEEVTLEKEGLDEVNIELHRIVAGLQVNLE